MIVVRYADDTIVGFQHRQDAERFLIDLKERLAKFALSLHPADSGDGGQAFHLNADSEFGRSRTAFR